MELVNLGVNIISYKKYGKNFAMTCAWVMPVNYDELYLLLGGQSDTSYHIEKGDIIGISALSSSQKDIALLLGENHSLQVNKLEKITYTTEETANIIEGAKVKMKGEVIDVFNPKDNDEDKVVHVKLYKIIEDENLEFLAMKDMK